MVKMQPHDVLVQASSNVGGGDGWSVIHRSLGPMGSLAWIQALSVARRVAREEKADIYLADANCAPVLHESHSI